MENKLHNINILAWPDPNSLLAGATSDIRDANVIVAMNGPMAHVYLRGNNGSWKTMPNIKDLALFASVLKRIFNEDGFFLDENLEIKLRKKFPNLLSSVDKVLIKIDGTYKIFGGLDVNGDPIPIELTSLNSPEYVRADGRINNLNPSKGSDLPDRSGDIILVMKDITSSALVNRFTTGVACKAWHGSLNQSDSYVPLILAYPGGNKYEVETIIKDTEGCSVVQGCDGNWNVYDLILDAIKKQY